MSERPRRAIAGANMAKLLMQEDKLDDFYKTAYGGFDEDATDGDYSTEREQSDVVDTDFDVPEESDEAMSGAEDGEGERKKRKKWEQKPVTVRRAGGGTAGGGGESQKRKERKSQPAPAVVLSVSRRTTTTVKSEISKIRRDHEARARVKRKVPRKEWKIPTQEEILEECRITEERNLELLHAFRLHEEQRKKTRATKRRATMGAYVRYHSRAAPIVKLGSLSLTSSPQHGANSERKITDLRYCTRNFITFSDPRIVPPFLQKHQPKPVAQERAYCPVTRQPAKYIDPLTLTPYASCKAFKMIRDSFNAYEEMRHESGGEGSGKRARKKGTDD